MARSAQPTWGTGCKRRSGRRHAARRGVTRS
jgi:hypothetical protein